MLMRGDKIFLVYSCSGSWQPTYKLGMLHMNRGDDPLAGNSWRKVERPVFDSTREVFGVGHCCFTTSPDGTEDWILYHSKRSRHDSWDREVRAQPFTWRADGFPDFGAPVSSSVPLSLPSGDMPAVIHRAA
jgi:GH43 family beta-xylosidase